MSTIKMLQELLQNKNPHICSLCFNIITEEEPFQLNDEVNLNPDECLEYTVLLSDMIEYVVHRADFVSSLVCNSCVTSTVNAYKFIKMCATATEKIYKFVDHFTSCLEQKDKREVKYPRRLFIATDVNSLETTFYYDKRNHLPRYKYFTKFQCTLHRFLEIRFPEIVPKFICDACGIVCRSKSSLCNHITNSCFGQEKKTACNICGMHISKKCIMRHERFCRNRTVEEFTMEGTDHSIRRKSYLCNICGKNVRNIKNHMLIHEPNHTTRYICSNCNKEYRWYDAYIKHIEDKVCNNPRTRNHSEPKPHKCEFCNSQYAKFSQLKHHMKIHSDNKDDYFECSWCLKKFSSNAALTTHAVKHTKQKDWTCNICDGQFVSKASLTYHIRRHTGEKPFKCELCDSSFSNASRRREHLKVYHLPPVECPYCHKKIGQRGINKHKKRHLNPKSSLYIGKLIDGMQKDSNMSSSKKPRKQCKKAATKNEKYNAASFEHSESDCETCF